MLTKYKLKKMPGPIRPKIKAIAENKISFLNIKQKKIIKVPFSCEVEDEEEIKFKTKGATSRAIPLDLKPPKDKKCFFSGKPAKDWVYFAKNY